MSLFSSNEEYFCTPFSLHNRTNESHLQIEEDRLEPENDYGNVEYKLRLTDPSPGRIEKLVTQLKWRIREGNGEAIVYVGVRDDGLFVGLTPDEARLSLETLERMTAKIGAKMTVVSERIVKSSQLADLENMNSGRQQHLKNDSHREDQDENSTELLDRGHSTGIQPRLPVRKVIQILVKRKTHDIAEELRVAVLGPTGSGKSSLLGVLSHGEYDNGRGSARLNLFRHRHEVRSGHTSSISQEIFGFSSSGQPLTHQTCLTTEEIIVSSAKVITLIDLAGHPRYLSTTLFGLGSHSPDVVLLVIDAATPLTSTTIDYVLLVLEMGKLLAVVINKTDLVTKEEEAACYDDLVRDIKNKNKKRRKFMKIRTQKEAKVAGREMRISRRVPVFFSSCVTGSGMDLLYSFFQELPPRFNSEQLDIAMAKSTEFLIDETFEIPGIGKVVSGLVTEGILREGDEMLIGPEDDASFSKVAVISLQRHKIPCNFSRAGQKCTMAIETKSYIRRGMVMIDPRDFENRSSSACQRFIARILFIGANPQRLSEGSQLSVYIANVKQTCFVESVAQEKGGSWLMDLRLTKCVEYIKDGNKLIARFGHSKGVGKVLAIAQLKRPKRNYDLRVPTFQLGFM